MDDIADSVDTEVTTIEGKEILNKVPEKQLRASLEFLLQSLSPTFKSKEQSKSYNKVKTNLDNEEYFYGRVNAAISANATSTNIKQVADAISGQESHYQKSISNFFIGKNLNYDKLFAKVPVMMHSIDKNGNIISVSEKWLDTLGYDLLEVKQKRAVDFFTSNSRQKALKHEIQHFDSNKGFSNVPYQMVKKDGGIIDVLLSSVALKDSNDDFICSLAICVDVSAKVSSVENMMFMQYYQNLPAMAVSFSLDGHILAISDRLLQRCVVSNVISELTLDKILVNSESLINKLLETDTLESYPVVLKAPVGPTEFLINAKISGNKLKAHVSAFLQEKTTTKVIKKETEPNRYKTALEASHIGVWDWGYVENKFHCSDELLKIVLNDNKQKLNCFDDLAACLCPKDKARLLNAVAKHLSDSSNLDITCKLKNELKPSWVNIKGSAIRDGNDNVIRIIGTIQDVTSRKDYETNLQRSNEELQHFAYVASHDLQEPLNSIITFSGYLKKNVDSSDSKITESLDYLLKSSYRMKDFISNLLEYSRVRHDDDNEFEEVNLNSVLDNIKEDYQHRIEKDNISLIIHDLPIVMANRSRIKQLFQNLISNAIKYRKPEANNHIVEVYASIVNNMHNIVVKDNGIGIDDKYKNIIFKLFERLNPYYDYPGTGIGLAICKKIIEQHGGDIKVKSAIGEGCEFIVTFPT